MKLPSPDELTDEDRADIASILRQMDNLADRILAGDATRTEHQALAGWIAFARGSGLVDPSAKHLLAGAANS
jgi:hypothetical protein